LFIHYRHYLNYVTLTFRPKNTTKIYILNIEGVYHQNMRVYSHLLLVSDTSRENSLRTYNLFLWCLHNACLSALESPFHCLWDTSYNKDNLHLIVVSMLNCNLRWLLYIKVWISTQVSKLNFFIIFSGVHVTSHQSQVNMWHFFSQNDWIISESNLHEGIRWEHPLLHLFLLMGPRLTQLCP